MKSCFLKLYKHIVRWVLKMPPYPEVWDREVTDAGFIRFIHYVRKDIPKDFKYFFQGELASDPRSIDEICDWLRQCKYVCDQDQFQKKDYWQHPKEFEENRRGDCEDHSLWAWRKIVELGYDAEFVVGQSHAWVHFIKDDKKYLLETVSKGPVMWHLIDEVKDRYTPHWSVDGKNDLYLYGGSWNWLRE